MCVGDVALAIGVLCWSTDWVGSDTYLELMVVNIMRMAYKVSPATIFL